LESFVTQLILATKKHEVSADNPPCLALFLDLDMAVLGKEMPAYLKYASLIREEYAHVPHEVYCEKRADILENFLTQDQIYGTQAMLEAFEQRARDNVAREIGTLRRGQIPGSSS
jgi:predicted metal-dependent HD superfamily phosphohydrolase